MKIIPSDMSRCAACDSRIQLTRNAGVCVIAPGLGIGYALCSACGIKARRGMPAAELARIDEKVGKAAAQHGISLPGGRS